MITVETIETHRKERLEGLDVTVVRAFPDYRILPSQTYLGDFAYTSKTHHFKLIHDRAVYYLPDGTPATPTDLARDYLTLKYPNGRGRIGKRMAQACYDDKRSQPLYAYPVFDLDGVYIDIKSAYWSILKIIGWDVEYIPSEFIGWGQDVSDYPFPHVKLSRNSLVSIALESHATIWTGQKILHKKTYNKYMNYPLWALVQDILHGVASEILPYAYYINTDGYIVHKDYENVVKSIIEDWGLESSIKYRGKCSIYGVGRYNIEGKKVIRHDPRNIEGYEYIREVNTDFIKKRMQKKVTRCTGRTFTDWAKYSNIYVVF